MLFAQPYVPMTVAARIAFVLELLNPGVDDDGEPIEPLVSQADALRLLLEEYEE